MGEGDSRAYRLRSIDLVRGIAIVLMALDHTRDFFSSAALDIFADLSQTPLAPFLTRWVTHVCAPAFVFLAGVSAGLAAARRGTGDLSRFLLQRGLWLLLIEMTVITFAWTFADAALPGAVGPIFIMQVIFAIGASMVILAALVWLPHWLLLPIGVAIMAGHNLLDGVWPPSTFLESPAPLWHALEIQTVAVGGGMTLVFTYPLLAWVGVMTAGFGAAHVFTLPEGDRRATLARVGFVLIAGFLVLRGFHLYGEPNAWTAVPGNWRASLVDFLDVTKYPPSLQYLLMTLGPALLLLAYAERWRGRIGDVLATFGRVPLLFYVAHLYLLRLGVFALGVWQGFTPEELAVDSLQLPPGFGVGLPGLYVVWLAVVVLLYFPCAWFAALKKRRRDWWLSYL